MLKCGRVIQALAIEDAGEAREEWLLLSSIVVHRLSLAGLPPCRAQLRFTEHSFAHASWKWGVLPWVGD